MASLSSCWGAAAPWTPPARTGGRTASTIPHFPHPLTRTAFSPPSLTLLPHPLTPPSPPYTSRQKKLELS